MSWCVISLSTVMIETIFLSFRAIKCVVIDASHEGTKNTSYNPFVYN